MEVKTPDWRIIERYNKDGTITKIKVDWNKIPCSTCEWRYHFGCPHCEWNKDGKYNTYWGANEGYKQGVVDGVKETVSPNNVDVKKNHYKQQTVNTISAGPNGVM